MTTRLNLLVAFFAGLLFALGLALSGMTQPAKVVGFLDFLSADWDASLLFVLMAASGSYAVLLPLITRRQRPVFAARFMVPTRRDITPRLVVGSALFGLGWGAAGFCPGPALTALASGKQDVVLFVAAMAAGMLLFELWDQRRAATPEQTSAHVTKPTEATALRAG
jgi:uncharacterized membrane protein YedE/YeeE